MERTVTEGLYGVRPVIAKSSAPRLWRRWRVRLAKTRCRLLHRSISYPVHGKYRCWICLSEFDTEW